MIKKDRNKIEFIRDIHEVFGDESKSNLYTPEKTKDERQAEVNAQIESINRRKEAIREKIRKKRQYFDEITVQVALLKKLVRRNMRAEDSDTSINTPVKKKGEKITLEKFQKTNKIYVPMLVLEFKKNSDIEVLMDEDHKQLVIFSDSQ